MAPILLASVRISLALSCDDCCLLSMSSWSCSFCISLLMCTALFFVDFDKLFVNDDEHPPGTQHKGAGANGDQEV